MNIIKFQEQVKKEIEDELASIPEKYRKPFNSTHEGLAIIQEEFEELKEEVFWGEKKFYQDEQLSRMRKEAVQTAAMCIRFIQELT
jgi:hypothetical protein